MQWGYGNETVEVWKVEVNPVWQQKKLVEFCKANGILVVAYAALGAVGTFYGTNRVMESNTLKEIAKARGKTIAQVLFDLVVSGLFFFSALNVFSLTNHRKN